MVSQAEPVMTMILVNVPTMESDANALPEELASRGLTSTSSAVKVISPDLTPALDLRSLTADQDAPDAVPEAAGDAAGHAMLFGRYMGQVIARIERAWVRPRSPLADSPFRCRVQITQGKQGDVREVMIVECNGDGRWQASLAAAIQTASPLPAPPDPSVFADKLILSFDSEPYHSGGITEGFEPEPTQLASASSFSLGPATSEIMQPKRVPGVVDLRITGTRDDSLSAPQPGTREAVYPPEPTNTPVPDAGSPSAQDPTVPDSEHR